MNTAREDDEHVSHLLTNLDYLKSNEILCDVTLKVSDDNRRFPCHRCVLAASSDYFRSMFTSGMREVNEREIELKGVSANGLQKAIEIVYTSKANLCGMDDIFDLISTATHLQIPSVQKFCEKHFLHGITIFNFVEFISMAKFYQLEQVLNQIDAFLIKNFAKISHTQYLKHVEFDQLLKILKSNDLKMKEIDIFELIWQWISDTSKSSDTQKIRDLMGHIRFALISPMDLVNKVQNIPYMIDDDMCRKLLLDALNYHLIPFKQPIQTSLNTRLRASESVIVSIGGREINPNPSLHDSCFMHALNTKCDNLSRQQHLTNLPTNLSHMQCVILNNFLFILGGCTTQCAHGESATNQVYRYDPRFNSWTQTASMLEKRAYFYACVLDLKIYCIGGKNREGSTSSCEVYDPSKNTWRLSHSLPAPYHAHSGVTHNNRVYISGGYSLGTFTPDLQVYSPNDDTWQDLSQMNTPRGWHCMCVHDDRLYVFAGCSLNPNTQHAQAVLQTEYYSITSNQWTIVSSLHNLHKEASYFKHDKFIFIVGGYNIQAKYGQKVISRYDFKRDVWDTIGNLPQAHTGCVYVSLDLPFYLFKCDEDTLAMQKDSNIIYTNYEYCNYEASSAAF